jgi:hypothetical protein
MRSSAVKTSLFLLLAIAAGAVPCYSKSTEIKQPLGELTTAVASKAPPEREERLGDRAYARALWAMDHANHVHFQHNNKAPADQIVERLNGDVYAETDTTGFASWVLYGVSPDRLWAVEALKPGRECPEAKTFARFFASLPMDKPLNGWIGVESILNLKKGDFIAWDAGHKRGGDGYVAIVAGAPGAPETVQIDGKPMQVVSLRVIDSSAVSHFPPEQLPPVADQKRRDGLGEGYVRLILGEDGKAVAHWEGGDKDGAQPTSSPIISFGRLMGAQHFPQSKSKDLGYERFQRVGPLTMF